MQESCSKPSDLIFFFFTVSMGKKNEYFKEYIFIVEYCNISDHKTQIRQPFSQ